MEYTGERFLPWVPNAQGSYEHYHRYLLALPFAKGKRVLDLASGEGYGTALLASVATEATGIDQDLQAVTHAVSNYIQSNLNYIHGSISDVPVHGQVYDLITCFEAIEHVTDQEKVLDEALRLLSDDGLLLISTPNKLVFSAEMGQQWSWHVHEFDYVEFRNFLENKFHHCIYLGQKTMMGSAIWPLQYSDGRLPNVEEIFVEKPEHGLRVVGAGSQTPMFFLAIASRQDLTALRQSLKSSSLIDVSLGLLKEKEDWIAKLKRDVETLDTMVRSKDVDLANLNQLIQSGSSAHKETLSELESLNETNTTSAAQLANLQEHLQTSEALVADLKNQLGAVRGYAHDRDHELHIATEYIAELHRGFIWRILMRVRSVADHIAPSGSPRRSFINKLKGYLRQSRSRRLSPPIAAPTPNEMAQTPAASSGEASAQVNQHYAVCTISSKNYLGLVRVFAESVHRSNPGIPVYVLLVDRVENKFDPVNEPYILITLDELDNIPNPPHFFFKYDPIELNTAAKPYFLDFLFRKFGIEKICYFDPDILVFSGLDTIWNLMDIHSMVITPHITSPYQDDLHPNEMEINLAGVFNLGFIALANTPTSAAFLTWWQARLYDYGYMNPSLGMHVDQNWVNFAPVMFSDVFILRDPAYNIAYWNLHERGHRLRFQDDTLYIDNRIATFFHFSGFDPDNINAISRHQNRFKLAEFPNLQPLFAYYRTLLQHSNYAEIKKWTYTFGRFDNGIIIPQFARVLYGRLSREQLQHFGDPFATKGVQPFFSWLNQPERDNQPGPTHLQMELYRTRVDLQHAFPDPASADWERFSGWLIEHATKDYTLDRVFLPIIPTLGETSPITYPTGGPQEKKARPFGVNVAGYLSGEFGVAEAARASIKSIEQAGIPHVINLVNTTYHRHEDKTFVDFSMNNPYRVNLVHVNADMSYDFVQQKGPEYFQERYNIGYWFWELSQFPTEWRSAFDFFQEIWVASAFCQESIARISPIPVVKMTFPVIVDDVPTHLNRSAFGLPEDQFLFGFVLDYMSLAERKNPMGLIKAFQLAFEDRTDVKLVIKTINTQHAPEKAAMLKDLVKNSNVTFIDGHLPRQEMVGLIASLDSYVSLHRSEGFGIGMAQAMYLRKPVIATGYSGNMDFMNHNNSYLVRYHLSELEQDYGPYKKGNAWAEPDLEHAAELMRLVCANRADSQEVAKRAEAHIKQQMSFELAGAAIKARLLALPGQPTDAA